MELEVFATKKKALYEAKKRLATAPERLLITGIETTEVEGGKGHHVIVFIDPVDRQVAMTDEEIAALAGYIVTLQEREEEMPSPVVEQPTVGHVMKPQSEWARSSVASPIAICKEVVPANRHLPRKEVIAILIARGVNKATAGTQYARITKTLPMIAASN